MIIPQQITDIARLVEARGLNDKVLSQLRGIYPGMYFTHCLDDEINNARPAWESARFNIYLVDARNHCLRLTEQPQAASGIVLAEIIDD